MEFCQDTGYFARTMIGISVIFALCLGCEAMAQPKMCNSDDQCHTGFYCVQGTFVCHECLNCEVLKRNPPLVPSTCIKSIAQCGSCIKGLVEDLRGDINAKCVPPDGGGEPTSASNYVGWIIGGLLFFIVIVLIFIYLLSRTDYLKILASTRASVRSPCGSPAASAPELPPPYSAFYAPVRPASPAAAAARELPDYDHEPLHVTQNGMPIKRVPSLRGGEARESDGNQATVPFNNPNYVRGPVLPSSVVVSDVTDREPFTVHDEDTMESDWTPAAGRSDLNGNAVGEAASPDLAAALAERASSALVPFSSRDARALSRQDKNNNRSNGEGAGSVDTSRAGRPAFYINTVVNINTVQQQNEFSQ